MGFWDSVWEGIKSVGKACYNAVSYAANVVTKTVQVVTKIVTPVVNVVTKVVDTVTKPLQKAASWVSQKIDKAKNWVLTQTAIGRAIDKGYNWIMDQTFIGKGIKYVKQKVTDAKQWFDKTPVGKVVNKIMPIVNIIGIACGGIPGLIGKVVNCASSAYNACKDPLSLIPGYDQVKDTLANNRITQMLLNNPVNTFIKQKIPIVKQKITSLAKKGEEYFQKTKIEKFCINNAERVKDYTLKNYDKIKNKGQQVKYFTSDKYNKLLINKLQNTQIGSYCINSGRKIIEFSSNNFHKLKDNAIDNLPNYYNKSQNIIQLGKKGFKYLSPKMNSLYEKFKSTKYGKKLDKGIQLGNKILYKPAKWVGSKTFQYILCPIGSYLSTKLEQSKFYQKYINGLVQKFSKIKLQAKHLKAKKITSNFFKDQLKIQNKQNGIDSSNMLSSYFNKSGSNQQSLEKIKQKFVNINDYFSEKINQPIKQSEETNQNNKQKIIQEQTLNSLVNSGKIKIESLVFDSRAAYGKSYTIQGRLKLQNKTNQTINFQILSGQMFGCSKTKTSQHTVTRGLKDTIDAFAMKQIILQSFCGDSSLKWPYEDTNYTMTNYLLKNFTDNQQQIWNQTNR